MKVLKGDLFKFFNDWPGSIAVAHVCNCQGVMGSGVALQVKQKYPKAYLKYKEHEEFFDKIRLGTISFAEIEPGKVLYNLHAQMFYGTAKRHLDYEAFFESLVLMRARLKLLNIETLAIPFNMGCDRAGGHWNIVTEMIKTVFEPEIEVYAIKYEKGK